MAIEDAIADLGAPERQESFRVTDLNSATWAMRKLAKVRAEQRAVIAAADAEIMRLQEWRRAEVERLERDGCYFQDLLIEYHHGKIAEDPRAKTIRLPHGELRCRAQQPEFTRDEALLLGWAHATDPETLVEVKATVRWAEVKKRGILQSDGTFIYAETGEVVPGVTGFERPPKFTVEVSADATDRG